MNTLYLDFIIDGSSSMYTVFPAVYYAINHIFEAFLNYSMKPQLGLTVFRNEKNGEPVEYIEFDKKELFTDSEIIFLKKLKSIALYGGGLDGRESVHTAIHKSLEKLPESGRNRAIIVFSDAYGSEDYQDYRWSPLGAAIFFVTEDLGEEDFRFAFIREDGELDEEASPVFLPLESILTPISSNLLEEVVKPLKDLMKGVSIGG